ncbi:hypothetical protein GEMRC1_010631 [Eukaryota sp. GEM-RC1]
MSIPIPTKCLLNSPTPVVIYNNSGVILDCSKSFSHLLRCGRNNLLHRHLSSVIMFPLDYSKWIDPQELALSGKSLMKTTTGDLVFVNRTISGIDKSVFVTFVSVEFSLFEHQYCSNIIQILDHLKYCVFLKDDELQINFFSNSVYEQLNLFPSVALSWSAFLSRVNCPEFNSYVEDSSVQSGLTTFQTHIGEKTFKIFAISDYKTVVGMLKDVSEDLSLKEKLKATEIELAETEKLASITHWKIYCNSNVLEFSPTIRRLQQFYLPVDQTNLMDVNTFIAMFDEEYQPDVENAFYSLKRDPLYSTSLDAVFINCKEEKLTVNFTANVSKLDESGNVVYAIGTLQDITSRTRLQDELRAFNTRLEDVVSALPDAIYTFETDHLVLVNASGRSLLAKIGASSSNDKSYSQFVTSFVRKFFDSELQVKALQIFLSDEEVSSDIDCLTSPDQGISRVSISKTINRARVIITIRDLTRVRETEAKLTEALSNARTANTARSQLLASTSHEIRTPISSILGVLSILTDTQLDSNQREMVNIIESCSSVLLALINDILDFSKIESGTVSLSPSKVRFADVMDDVVSLFKV